MADAPLVGRERELRVLGDLLDRAPERGGALVVRGEAGIGKSALLAAASRRARERGMLVLTVSGVQSEANLPFAGLHQLLRPILAGVDALPDRQRAAVAAAFGMSDAAAPELFLIALATLELLGDAAVTAPLLLLVEDAQWLDRPSSDVLTFVARRLEAEPIVLLAAIREGIESAWDEASLPELRLEGLDDGPAAALLDAYAPTLTAALRARLLAEAAGNPLALVELPAALAARPVDAGPGLPVWLPLTTRLEQAFVARVADLPATTRTLLLVAAANDGRLPTEIMAAAAAILNDPALSDEALEPAVAVGLVETDERELRFRHPLVRSAIYQAAGPSQRRAAHAALAEALGGQPDRSVWHRAAAAIGPDETVAADMEAAAIRAQARGGIEVAVAALERAARLSIAPSYRGRRLLRAAELAFELGRSEMVIRLVREAEPLELTTLDRGHLVWIREMVDPNASMDAAHLELLVETAERMRALGDTEIALLLLRAAADRASLGEPGPEARASIVAAAERVSPAEDAPSLLAILANAAPVERGAFVIERVTRRVAQGATDAALFTAVSVAGDFELATRMSVRAIAALRAQGRLGRLVRVLLVQAWLSLHVEGPRGAAPAVEEFVRLTREMGWTLGSTAEELLWGASARTAEAMLAAFRGDPAAAEACVAEIDQEVLRLGISATLASVQLVRGVTALSAGRYVDAYTHLRRLFDRADPAFHVMERCNGIAYFVEAAVHSGNREEARALLEDVETAATRTPSPKIHQRLRYARPLLADDEDAEALYLAALEGEPPLWPLLQASLQLAYGAWLRRQRRVAESRPHLRAARNTFEDLGALPWGERARQELRAAGEVSARRTPGMLDVLTAQELQIAELAAAGRSNREIGEQLFLSHRTVSTHLYHIFPKLGVTARAELRAALVGGGAAPA